ncbi:MAG: hypothetical protein ABI844_08075 [Saprospiraceae bacterium]
MSEKEEKEYIQKCLIDIETKLGWGASVEWSNYDLEKLSDEILVKTNVALSVTTLKRLWGKVKHDHSPSLTTLNTLAQFLGFEDWRTYRLNNLNQPLEIETVHPSINTIEVDSNGSSSSINSSTWNPQKWMIIAAGLFLTIIGIAALNKTTQESSKKITKYDSSKFSFKANKVLSKGLPNSVIFDYDASASLSESIYISQSWDIRRKVRVDKNNHHHSAIYYYPGYFRTKLIIDSQIVKTFDIQIATDGWLGLIENESTPIYFDQKDIMHDGIASVDTTDLNKYHVDLKPISPHIRLFNQDDLGNITNDNFTFRTTLKNDYKTGDNACQFSQVLIQCVDDIIIIPLCARPCIGDITLAACGSYFTSKESDLSGFGTDLNNWTTLKVECKDKHMIFFVNDQKAYELTFPHEAKRIVGVQYRFNGTAAVKETVFESNGLEKKL